MNCEHGNNPDDCMPCRYDAHQRTIRRHERIMEEMRRQRMEYWLAVLIVGAAIVLCLSIRFGWGKPRPAIVVFPLKRQFWTRLPPHVLYEIRERIQPSFTDLNASPAISVIVVSRLV